MVAKKEINFAKNNILMSNHKLSKIFNGFKIINLHDFVIMK